MLDANKAARYDFISAYLSRGCRGKLCAVLFILEASGIIVERWWVLCFQQSAPCHHMVCLTTIFCAKDARGPGRDSLLVIVSTPYYGGLLTSLIKAVAIRR